MIYLRIQVKFANIRFGGFLGLTEINYILKIFRVQANVRFLK